MSETTDKIVDKIVGDATSRLKIPIVSTYLCVLIINNWDILYFILFSKVDATSKILYVKTHYDFWDYLWRVGGSLIYAIFILVIFTFLDYYLVKWLKDISIKKKTVQQQIVDHNTLEDLKKTVNNVSLDNISLKESNNKLKDDNYYLSNEISGSIDRIKELEKNQLNTLELNKILLSDIIIDLFNLKNEDNIIVNNIDALNNILGTIIKESSIEESFELNRLFKLVPTDLYYSQFLEIMHILNKFSLVDFTYIDKNTIYRVSYEKRKIKVIYDLLNNN
ncbi:hypothetical protein [Empedobacter brevis]|uniref:hypothetical protein n=1 Tax=Empedobacter brevis TaxID=247 RepID=UPI00333FB13A